MARSVAVIVFIAIVAATGIYFWQRPTVARGDVIASDLVRTNESVKAMTCDQDIPIDVDGATFHCGVEFKAGGVQRMKFAMDRNGKITQQPQPQQQQTNEQHPPVKKTSDPWGD
ncbi:MAG TPA: hypothetical protein VIV11_03480 [Kofleriaceae bacterium]